MKKVTLICTLILVIIASFALPTFASDNCDPNQDYHTLGRQQFDAGDTDSALNSVNCGLALNPDSYALYMLRAVIYCNTDRIELAIADMTTAIELRPESAYAYNNRGWANYRLGNLEDAMLNLNFAISLDPELAYAYNNRGLVYQTLGFREQALDDYQMAIDLGLEQAWAEINLYNLEFEMARLEVGR